MDIEELAFEKLAQLRASEILEELEKRAISEKFIKKVVDRMPTTPQSAKRLGDWGIKQVHEATRGIPSRTVFDRKAMKSKVISRGRVLTDAEQDRRHAAASIALKRSTEMDQALKPVTQKIKEKAQRTARKAKEELGGRVAKIGPVRRAIERQTSKEKGRVAKSLWGGK